MAVEDGENKDDNLDSEATETDITAALASSAAASTQAAAATVTAEHKAKTDATVAAVIAATPDPLVRVVAAAANVITGMSSSTFISGMNSSADSVMRYLYGNNATDAYEGFVDNNLSIINNGLGMIGGRVGALANDIEVWLGSDARPITNGSGDKIFVSADGQRRIRFDINNPFPHNNPHSHVEVLVNGIWVKSGPVYPTDVPHN